MVILIFLFFKSKLPFWAPLVQKFKIVINAKKCTVKAVSLTSSTMKNIDVFPAHSIFPVKVICCIAFHI